MNEDDIRSLIRKVTAIVMSGALFLLCSFYLWQLKGENILVNVLLQLFISGFYVWCLVEMSERT